MSQINGPLQTSSIQITNRIELFSNARTEESLLESKCSDSLGSISILLREMGQRQSNRVRYESSWGNLFNITQSELPSQEQSHFVGVWKLAAVLRARNTLIFILQRRKWVNIVVRWPCPHDIPFYHQSRPSHVTP